MAIIKRRYRFRGPSENEIALEVGGTLVAPTFYQTADVQFDDLIALPATVDEVMFRRGYVPEPIPTTLLAPSPFIGLVSPLGDVWALSVNAIGVLSTLKVN